MSEPTKPGYYWAKRKRYEEEWQIVRVSLWSSFTGLIGVDCFDDEGDRLEHFTFGPEVTKPEGIE